MKSKMKRMSFEKRREMRINRRSFSKDKKESRGDRFIPVSKVLIGNSGICLLTHRPITAKEENDLSKRFFLYKRKDGKVYISKRPLIVVWYEGAVINIADDYQELIV